MTICITNLNFTIDKTFPVDIMATKVINKINSKPIFLYRKKKKVFITTAANFILFCSDPATC